MLSTNTILDLLREHKPVLEKKFFLKEIGLFGSYARNEAHADSDIDLIVALSPPSNHYIENLEALRAYLKTLFGKDIDLANPRSLKPHFKDRILKQVIYV